jgi:anti-sigma B factor antagonist
VTLQEHEIGDVTIVELAGRITIEQGADRLRDTIDALVQEGRTKVVLDLGKVPQIDSTTLGEIVRAQMVLRRKGGSLELLRVPLRIRNVFVSAKLLGMFETFESEADALERFILTTA